MRLGIDLGTTFSCVSILDQQHWPSLVVDASGSPLVASVLWFDGSEAWVGRAAYDREREKPGGFVDYVKRDMGKPAEIPPHLYDTPDAPETAPYRFGGFPYGVVGMQALMLRALKRHALRHAARTGQLPDGWTEDHIVPDVVITVPAYFKDIEREQTRQAGELAGMRVIGIINEPTAAALAYRPNASRRRLMVFDLGGGTFDVTILDLLPDGTSKVLASDGNPRLGGKDFDQPLEDHLRAVCFLNHGDAVPPAYDVLLRRKATEAKIRLSEASATTVDVSLPSGEQVVVNVERTRPPSANPYDLANTTFYFEGRAQNLLTSVRAICERTRRSVLVATPDGSERELLWGDLDEVVMVGGSCRMPMVAELLETLTGKAVQRHPEGFDFDTAVALGAGRYAERPDLVQDVMWGTLGVKLRRRVEGMTLDFVQPLIRKNTALPVRVERTFRAGHNAVLELYIGESDNPDECAMRGRLELGNPEGEVTVEVAVDRDGRTTANVHFPGVEGTSPVTKQLVIRNDLFAPHLANLATRVRSVRFHDNEAAPEDALADYAHGAPSAASTRPPESKPPLEWPIGPVSPPYGLASGEA